MKYLMKSLTGSWVGKRVAGQGSKFNPGLPFCTSNIVAVPVLERGVPSLFEFHPLLFCCADKEKANLRIILDY